MPAFNFRAQFADAVENYIKLQTMRFERKDGRIPCKAGEILSHYTGMRTKNCRLLIKPRCVSISPVRMHCIYGTNIVKIAVNRNLILDEDAFAKADGFKSHDDLVTFFQVTHARPFIGWLIKWEKA